MTILGITAEYDPFHNGHAYHLEQAKKLVCPDVAISVMSGDITQRGEFAVLDKWTRAQIAVEQGLDMVLELPFVYACSPAGVFAQGAVDILASAGVSHIAFGCEAEDPEQLEKLARLQISKASEIEDLTREMMKDGSSHVKARSRATSEIIGEELTILSITPNNILALEYLKRMIFWEENGLKITPVPILRKGSGYKDHSQAVGPDPEKDYAGGSAIREMLKAGWNVDRFLPYDSTSTSRIQWTNIVKVHEKSLEHLKGIILRSSPKALANIRFVGEGIENRLIRDITEADTYDELLKKATSKRYTTSTIRRMLMNIMLGVTKEMGASDIPDNTGEGAKERRTVYGRILALDDAGRRHISSEPGIAFVTNVNKTDGLTREALECLDLDIRAADLFNLLTGRNMNEDTDHRKKPYIK